MKITDLKLLNGIKYFINNTNNIGLVKLFKLLYFWDFIHFKLYGTSITGLNYYAYQFGPVPKKMYNEISSNKLPELFYEHLKVIELKLDEYNFKQYKFHLKDKNIDLEWLSPNEIGVLEDVAEIFKYSTATEMTEITHLKNSPWDITQKENRFGEIDYFLALDNDTTLDIDVIKERFQLQKELLADGRI